jgi:hypothetical protein
VPKKRSKPLQPKPRNKKRAPDRRHIPKKLWVEWSGRGRQVLDEQHARYGLPVKGATIDLAAVARWVHDLLAAHGRKINADEPEMLAAEVSSPALERYRELRCAILELEYQIKCGQLVSVAHSREFHTLTASVLRDAGRHLQLRHGQDAYEVLSDALDECERLLEIYFADAA